jgi:glycosyltransferase involved in cell wall biosynthesis
VIQAKVRRVCFVMPFHIEENRGGGAEVQAWFLARELARRGLDVRYLAQSVTGKAGTEEMREGVRLHWLPHRSRFEWLAGRQWYRALQAIDPDLVVQRMTSAMTGIIGLYARRHRKAFAWICTEDDATRRWHFWKQQRRANRELRAGAAKSLVFLGDALVRDLWRDLGMRCVTHAFAQSEFQRERLRAAYGIETHHMPSGHEAPPPCADRERRRRGGIVLWAGNMGRRKRPEAFVELARRNVGSRARFVMLGDRAAGGRAALAEGSPPNLEMPGRLPFDEALRRFDDAALFVNTSRSEGFPNTLIQAWLRGVPTLTLGVDPDGTIAREGIGLVAHDLETLSSNLTALLDDPQRYAAMSDRAERFARAHFTVERIADAFLAAMG